MKIKTGYVGKWRIIEMSEWDRDFIDLVAPGHLTIKADGTGTFAFGAFEAEVDCQVEKKGDHERLVFSFEGFDEGDEANGEGWATVQENQIEGWFRFHSGDESTFKAQQKRKRV
jgi:hypothetical protein